MPSYFAGYNNAEENFRDGTKTVTSRTAEKTS